MAAQAAADASAFVPRRGNGLGGALFLIPAVVWELASGKTIVLDAVSVASFAIVCVFPSLLGYLCLNRGIELIGANRAAPFMHLVPVFGSVLAIVLLGERFELYHAVGYALVFAGITMATRKPAELIVSIAILVAQ